MDLSININLENDTFLAEEGEDSDFNTEEIAHSFKSVMRGINSGITQGSIMDRNGNTVGTWKINI